ncbi:MAG TPA: DUF6289 family protein [Thermoanaerobaculia bacterium]|jgi:hypothetical protein
MNVRKTVILLLVLASFASVASSLPANSTETEWYDDDTYTNVVGWRYIDCSGARSTWGVRTNWYRVWGESCNGSGGYCQTCYVLDGYTYCNYLC